MSVLLLTALFIFAGWFTLYGPINILAWRGGTFPPTEPDRPFYQQAIKDVARYQYDEQPNPNVYFGLACGASLDDLNAVLPRVGSHHDSDANSEADPGAVAAAAAYRPGANMSRAAAGVGGGDASDLDTSLDALSHEVDCSGAWTAPFLSFLLASAGVPLYGDPALAGVGEPAGPRPGGPVPGANSGAGPSAGTSSSNGAANAGAGGTNTGVGKRADSDGAPTTANPWLVTDVDQLMQAFKDHGAFMTDPDFSPQVGDIIFYKYPAGLGVHANMVVAVRDEWVTIGGDELGKVGLASMTLRNRGGIIGYGATGLFEYAPLVADS